MYTLDQAVAGLANSRAKVVRWTEKTAEAWRKMAKTEAYLTHEQHKSVLDGCKADVAKYEKTVRNMAVTNHEQGGDDNPHVKIVNKRVVSYNVDKAVEWAAKTGQFQFLKLDSASFRKVAGELKLDFVEVTQEPAARISSKLPTGGNE